MKLHLNKLFLLFPILFLGNCFPQPESGKSLSENLFHQNELRFLALGDSYTIGESVPENERWPIQLSDSLSTKGFIFKEINIIATTGWTTSELQAGILDAAPDSSYDMVSLLIGVNNQYRGYNTNIYRTEFKELLEQAIVLANRDMEKVFVVSIPNYGVTPFGQSLGEDRIRKELLYYDAIADSIAQTFGVPFVNITPISEDAKTDPGLIAGDQLHPSGKMYSLWVQEILPVAEKLLQQ